MEEQEEQERRKSGKCRKSGKSKKIRKSRTSGKRQQKAREPGGRRDEASKRQANLQNGRHERLYRKAGFIVLCGQPESRKMKTKGSKLLNQ